MLVTKLRRTTIDPLGHRAPYHAGLELLEERRLLTASAVIKSPVAVVSNTGGSYDADYSINHTIDHSGLFTGFTNGVTDFNTYIASQPQHDTFASDFEWWPPDGVQSSTIVYDLGTALHVEKIALWNEELRGIVVMSVYTSNDPTFATGSTFVGNFNPHDNPLELDTYGPEVLDIDDSVARYVKVDVSNMSPPTLYSGSFYREVTMGEIAFAVTVPVNPPALDLNGATAGTDTTTNWIGASVVIVDNLNAIVSDADGGNLSSIVVRESVFHTGDVLSANTTGTTISQTYSNGSLTLSGSDTIAHYQQVLRTVSYNNTAGGPGVNTFPVTFVANDGTTNSNTATATVNAPPVIRLNGVNGANTSTTWYNNGGDTPVPRAVVANGAVALSNMAQASITDAAGLTSIQSMTVKLVTPIAGDVLSAPILAGTSITGSFSSVTGILTLTGPDTLAHFQQELRVISYNNTNGGPLVTQLKVAVSASDGTVTGNAVTSTVNIAVPTGTQILGNRLFYNNSKYDSHAGTGTTAGDPGINSFDDSAVASDKIGFNGTGTATFANVSSSSKGITGIIIDIKTGIGSHSLINRTSGDLTFKVAPTVVTGTYNQISTWSSTLAPAPANISVRLGAGVGGSDRIEITWASSVAVKNNWLEIKLKAGGNSGLAADDVFYFGNNVGNTGIADPAGQSKTEPGDAVLPQTNTLGLTTQVFQIMDYDKSGTVDPTDSVLATSNVNVLIRYIANPTGPFAPDGGTPSATPAAVAAALPASSSSGTSSALTSGLGLLGNQLQLPASLAGRLDTLLHTLPVDKLKPEATIAPKLHQAVDQIVARLHAHDDVLEGLLKDLGLY